MGLFDNNVITPSSIERLGKDIKRAFDTRMDLEKNIWYKLRLGSPSSADVKEMLNSLVIGEYRERLMNNEVYLWQVNAIKKTSGNAHISYIINFVIYTRFCDMNKMFQYEYIWR